MATIELSRAGEIALARAVETVIVTKAAPAPEDWKRTFAALPPADRVALLGASPRDALVTALKCWRQAAKTAGDKWRRTLTVAAVVPTAARLYPAIRAAQEALQ